MKHRKNQNKQCSNGECKPDPTNIEHRAYELYLERGSSPGNDFQDWLQAERELKDRGEATMSHS